MTNKVIHVILSSISLCIIEDWRWRAANERFSHQVKSRLYQQSLMEWQCNRTQIKSVHLRYVWSALGFTLGEIIHFTLSGWGLTDMFPHKIHSSQNDIVIGVFNNLNIIILDNMVSLWGSQLISGPCAFHPLDPPPTPTPSGSPAPTFLHLLYPLLVSADSLC